jgi:hypothetical protein
LSVDGAGDGDASGEADGDADHGGQGFSPAARIDANQQQAKIWPSTTAEAAKPKRTRRAVDWYSVFKDFVGPVTTLCAAVAAAYFARQQSNTAKRQAETAAGLAETAKRQAETAIDQLRFNLFEKRYAVYEETKQLIRLLVSGSDPRGPDLNAVARHFVAIAEARFFFSSATCQWLETVREDCQKLLDLSAEPTPANAQARAELKRKLAAHVKAMPERFRDELSFRQLTDTVQPPPH